MYVKRQADLTSASAADNSHRKVPGAEQGAWGMGLKAAVLRNGCRKIEFKINIQLSSLKYTAARIPGVQFPEFPKLWLSRP